MDPVSDPVSESLKPSIKYDEYHAVQLTVSTYLTTFYKVKVEPDLFHELPSSNLTVSAPYHAYGEMTEREFPGWQKLCRVLSTFCCSATYSDPISRRFAVKGSLLLETEEAQQISAERLQNEAIFYSRYLKDHQGDIVPRHYGLWYAPETKWGGQVLVAIMDWGGLPWGIYERRALDTMERRIRIAEAVDKLHDDGICLGQPDFVDRHTLFDDQADSFRIVDFSKAYAGHSCTRMLPARQFLSSPSSLEFGCFELHCLRRYLRVFGISLRARHDPELITATTLVEHFLRSGKSRQEALRIVGGLIDEWRSNPNLATIIKKRGLTPGYPSRGG